MTDVRPLVPTPRQVETGDPTGGATVDPVPGAAVDGRPEAGAGAGARAEVSEARSGRAWRTTLRDADPRRIPGPKTPLAVFGLIALLSQWDDAALGTLLPEIRADLGLSTQVLAAISSAVSILALALGIPFGHLADRVRRTTMLRVGIVATNLASVVQAMAPGLGQLVAGRLVAGAGVGLQQPASFSYLADTYPSTSRTRVFGFTFLVAQLGAIAGPAVAGLLGQLLGWRLALGGLGALATAVALLTFLLREPVRGRLDRLESGASAELASVEQDPLPLGEAMRAAWSVQTVRRIVLATPFLYLKGAASLTLLALYFSEVFVLTPGQRGLIGALYALLGMVGLILAAPLGDRLLANRPDAFLPLAAAGLAVQAGALALLGFTSNVGLAIAVAAPLSALDVVLAPAFFSLLSQVVPARLRGLGLQIITPAQLLGILAFPLMAGFADSLGLQRGIALFALPTLVGALILAGGGPGTARDRRSALAAGLAEEAARRAADAGRRPVLVARDIDAGYGGVPVVRGVDLDVDSGEVLAVLGPNGAGKTTLARAITGSHPPMTGAVSVAGRDATTTAAHQLARRGVALVPGGQAVIPDLTVEEHLVAAAELGAGGAAAVDAAFAEHAALAERRHNRAGSLSGGEQQLLALVAADLAQPRLLVIDELSLGLAPRVAARALASARQAADRGAAVVLIEQAAGAAVRAADRVLLLDKGATVFEGTASEAAADRTVTGMVALGGGRRTIRAGRPPVEGPARLQVEGLCVDLGGGGTVTRIVEDVSLAAAGGELVGLIGPNGAGKTTVFDAISGFVPTSSGRVAVDGADLGDLAPAARAALGVGRSFQRARLFPGLTALDAVLVSLDRRAGSPLAALGLPSARRAEARLRRRAEGTLELLGLERWAAVAVGDLPTGIRRLVSLACTLAFEPKVLLLDEPTAGLSRAEAEDIPPLLRRTARETGAAVLVVEHDVPLLAAAADRLVALVQGRVVADGQPSSVIADPTVVEAYLGPDPEAGPDNRGQEETL